MVREAVWVSAVRLRWQGRAVTIEAIQEDLYERTGAWFERVLVLEGLAGLVLENPACWDVVFAEEEEA